MQEKSLRIAIVGAATLLGKALNDELAASAFGSADFQLMDDEDALGKLASSGDEVTFVQRIEPESFDGCDFTFFAGHPEITRKHWRQALKAGSSIIDLSGALEDTPGVMIRSPWVQEEQEGASPNAQQTPAPDLQTYAVVSAHPVAVLLALLTARSRGAAPVFRIWATLLQPASEYGHAALEELHQQTTNLLSFQPLSTEVFGGQAAFNLVVSFGEEGRVKLAEAADAIRRHYAKIAPVPKIAEAASDALALQVIQVPIFHGYALSIAIELERPVAADAMAQVLAGPHVKILSNASEFPGNVQAVEEDGVQILVQPVLADDAAPKKQKASKHAALRPTSRFWLWIVADNLKFAAQNAVACAAELNRLRPRGKVQ